MMIRLLLGVCLPLWLWGSSPAFEAFRQSERAEILSEFKKLYKERRHLHRSLKQMLKHARAKKLNRKDLNLFQPKDASSDSLFEPIEQLHPMENSRIFYAGAGCEGECGDDASETTEEPGSEISGGDTSAGDTNGEKVSGGLRPNVQNPWARK